MKILNSCLVGVCSVLFLVPGDGVFAKTVIVSYKKTIESSAERKNIEILLHRHCKTKPFDSYREPQQDSFVEKAYSTDCKKGTYGARSYYFPKCPNDQRIFWIRILESVRKEQSINTQIATKDILDPKTGKIIVYRGETYCVYIYTYINNFYDNCSCAVWNKVHSNLRMDESTNTIEEENKKDEEIKITKSPNPIPEDKEKDKKTKDPSVKDGVITPPPQCPENPHPFEKINERMDQILKSLP